MSISIQAQNSSVEPGQAAKIEWLSLEEAIQASLKEPKKIFIDVYTSWCGWCKVMDRKTFAHPEIAAYMNENFYAVKFDGEYKEEIDLNGQKFKFVANGRRGYHELAAALLNNRMSYPSCVVMGSDWKRLSIIPGYNDPADLDRILRFFAKDLYTDTSFEEYKKEYTSDLKEVGQ